MRPIDADELMEKVWRFGLGTREDVANMIENMPTIDFGDIVRCRNCRWWDTSKEWTGREGKGRCEIINLLVGPEEYCACGERREDDTD